MALRRDGEFLRAVDVLLALTISSSYGPERFPKNFSMSNLC